ncbi:STAS domain-containing protein [Streptomyces glaucescens]|uniref:STAS domain-containing protein n=1 Tax=Streptomyces glaucescens TaxID=1907 RepID=UPI00344B0337
MGDEPDHDSGHDLAGVVRGHLVPGVRDVRLDFTGLTRIDPLGPAALLMPHRHTSAVRATLHLDNRPEALERVLRQTGVLAHLTAPAGGHRPPT